MEASPIENFAILDFEASSLSRTSWPIEVGLSWVEGGAIQTWASLIRPHADWDPADWSQQSAAVHGICLEDLRDAPHAADVVRTLFKVLEARRLVSDAPEFESRWLARLLLATDQRGAPVIEDFDSVSFAIFDGFALDMLYETVERRPAPHRAGPDTARLARGWLKAMEHSAAANINS